MLHLLGVCVRACGLFPIVCVWCVGVCTWADAVLYIFGAWHGCRVGPSRECLCVRMRHERGAACMGTPPPSAAVHKSRADCRSRPRRAENDRTRDTWTRCWRRGRKRRRCRPIRHWRTAGRPWDSRRAPSSGHREPFCILRHRRGSVQRRPPGCRCGDEAGGTPRALHCYAGGVAARCIACRCQWLAHASGIVLFPGICYNWTAIMQYCCLFLQPSPLVIPRLP